MSQLCPTPEPLAVAMAFRDRLGLDRLYVADLDALAGDPPALATFRRLADAGFELFVDAGARSTGEAQQLLDTGVTRVIAPLETLPGPDALAELVAASGPERVLFSLDLKNGVPFGEIAGWEATEPVELADRAVDCGVTCLLVLDLAAVGSAGGPAHLSLLAQVSRRHPTVELLTGGGVRTVDDLRAFGASGVSGVLVATALHDGSLSAGAR